MAPPSSSAKKSFWKMSERIMGGAAQESSHIMAGECPCCHPEVFSPGKLIYRFQIALPSAREGVLHLRVICSAVKNTALSTEYLSINRLQITLFAVHRLRSLGSIGGGNKFVAIGTISLPQFSWISQSHSFLMTNVGMKVRNRQIHLPVEFQFRFLNPERFFGCCAFDRPV